jgi:hypothetical protein
MVSDARETIRGQLRDAVTRLLLSNSQLTPTQLETLLADSLPSDAKKGRRPLFRPSKTRISRGSYNRTLFQAQNNVIRSIYTVLLLGYVGLFDTAALQPFLELSDTIQSYARESQSNSPIDRNAIDQLNKRLMESVSALAKRQSFKDIL